MKYWTRWWCWILEFSSSLFLTCLISEHLTTSYYLSILTIKTFLLLACTVHWDHVLLGSYRTFNCSLAFCYQLVHIALFAATLLFTWMSSVGTNLTLMTFFTVPTWVNMVRAQHILSVTFWMYWCIDKCILFIIHIRGCVVFYEFSIVSSLELLSLFS